MLEVYVTKLLLNNTVTTCTSVFMTRNLFATVLAPKEM